MWPAAQFAPGSAVLAPGDVLVLYTDGVVEVTNASGEMFGVDRLEHVIRRAGGCLARGLVAAVVDATQAFAGRAGYDDDFTLVVVMRQPDGSGGRA
jgi:sigma-B regulation protein RsbU (phosphoserine phosphatase)